MKRRLILILAAGMITMNTFFTMTGCGEKESSSVTQEEKQSDKINEAIADFDPSLYTNENNIKDGWKELSTIKTMVEELKNSENETVEWVKLVNKITDYLNNLDEVERQLADRGFTFGEMQPYFEINENLDEFVSLIGEKSE